MAFPLVRVEKGAAFVDGGPVNGLCGALHFFVYGLFFVMSFRLNPIHFPLGREIGVKECIFQAFNVTRVTFDALSDFGFHGLASRSLLVEQSGRGRGDIASEDLQGGLKAMFAQKCGAGLFWRAGAESFSHSAGQRPTF